MISYLKLCWISTTTQTLLYLTITKSTINIHTVSLNMGLVSHISKLTQNKLITILEPRCIVINHNINKHVIINVDMRPSGLVPTLPFDTDYV